MADQVGLLHLCDRFELEGAGVEFRAGRSASDTTSKTISGVSYSEFQTQTLTIKDATADTQIEFTSPSDVPSTRWFIDDICVTK